MSKTELNKKLGELFVERANINLNSDLLSIPDFFYDEGRSHKDKYSHSLQVGQRGRLERN